MIPKETIDKIFDAARIEEVVGDFVNLKKRGVNLIGLCPFHNEKTPSFNVNPVRGIYKCFGCGKGGNAVNFIMEHEQMNYPEALRYLANKYHIEIEEKEQTPEEKIQQDARESLYVVSSFAQKHFTGNLFNTDEGRSIGLSYFRERGFRQDIIEKFQLGYCLDQWRGFSDAALAAGYKLEFMEKTGLTIVKHEEENPGISDNPGDKSSLPAPGSKLKFFDRFSARVMFPIHNVTGRVIGFGGRTLKTDKKVAKYVNSPESDIYHKSKVLYGLFFAKKMIIAEDNCFLVEGYTDVISLHQSGIENVVASSGTSLTTEQIRLIKRYTNNITILYDGDMAGIKASFRGIDMILEEGLNVRVLLFPDNDDPDSYSKKVSSEELKKFIRENSKDFIAFKAGLLYEEARHDPIKRAELIKQIVESIALIPEAIHRSVYIQECSRIMNMDEQTLLNELNKIRRKNFNDKLGKGQEVPVQDSMITEPVIQERPQPSDITGSEFQERDLLRILLQHGEKHIRFDSEDEEGHKVEVDVSVAEYIMQELDHDRIDFDAPHYKRLLDFFYEHYIVQQHTDPIPNNFFLSHAEELVSKTAIDILSSPYSLAAWDKHKIPVTLEENMLKRSVQSAIYSLKMRRLEMMITENQKQLKECTNEEDVLILITEQQSLLEAKKAFSAQLGRVVIK
ncbi:MAG TPA: DNA primase [Bacteroidia bacterium]